jgi:glycosyltransferase involved in cell wall biosynthesis
MIPFQHLDLRGEMSSLTPLTEDPRGPLNFLWVIDFEHEKRLHHGAFIRYFNFSPELIAQGHTVVFAVNFLDADRGPSREYFEQLKAKGVFTDFVEVNLEIPLWRTRLAARLFYPGLANPVLRPFYRRFAARIDSIVGERNSNVIVISSNRLFFLQMESRTRCAFIFDIGDCYTLYYRRQIRVMVKNFDFRGILRVLKPFALAFAREHYYSRLPVTKMMVSPVDKEAIDQISGIPDTSAVVLNGVRDGSPRGRFPKIPGRIIFTGNMDFPPNYEAALWFLDNVFPLVLRKRPDVCFVIAGANPIPALLARASKNITVTGYVDDLNREIASSEMFVAPLITGGGFKNKVVEAFVNRTYVIATSIAVEFLNPELRDLVSVANTPEEMADAILAVWSDPIRSEACVEKLHELVTAQFGWSGRACEVVALARVALART